MTAKTTFTATAPDQSTTETRNSKRTYTHAAWGFGGHYAGMHAPNGSQHWVFIGFAGREDLAQKAANSWKDHYKTVAVVEVVAG